MGTLEPTAILTDGSYSSTEVSDFVASVGRYDPTHDFEHEVSCFLKKHRYPMSDSRVFSLPIVVRFNVFKYPGFCHAPSGVPFTVNEFDFQRVKKALHCRIVVTVSPASHAAAQTVILDQLLISL